MNIVLGVSGGIAAYKSPEIVRRLVDAGHSVRVVTTAGAEAFVTPLTFQAVSGKPVHRDLLDETAEAAMGHIELARWADVVLGAPATANLMARLAHGLADDLLSTLCLATSAPIVLAPAMNQQMWRAPATRSNLATLVERRVRIIGPDAGWQACGDVGPGRMSEPAEIVSALLAGVRSESPEPPPSDSARLSGVRVLVTAGPTREAIDPVRFISNHSSGKMGFAVAAAAHGLGADVDLVAGPVRLDPPAGVAVVAVASAAEMHREVMSRATGCDIFIATAAVADYAPAAPAPGKIKKASSPLHLELRPTRDILAEVAALDDAPFTVGFAAETDELERHARAKLERKGLDLIAGNRVGGPDLGFESDRNALLVLWPGGGRAELPAGPKSLLARQLLSLVAERFLAERSVPHS